MYAFINIFGLAAGMACCILILLWARDELSFDRFHQNHENIYRVVADWPKYSWEGMEGTPQPLGKAVKEHIPEVADTVRISSHSRAFLAFIPRSINCGNCKVIGCVVICVFLFPEEERPLSFSYKLGWIACCSLIYLVMI